MRIVVSGDGPGGAYEASVETEAKRVEGTDLWFPAKVTFLQTIAGKMNRKEVVTVKRASLNEPVDDVNFTLAGMDIAEGTVVRGPIENGKVLEWVWQGGKRVPRDQVPPPPPALVPGPDPARQNLYTSLAIAFAGAGIVAFIVYFLRRRARARAA